MSEVYPYISSIRDAHYFRQKRQSMKYFYGRQSKDETAQKNSIATQIKLVEDKVGKCDGYYTDIAKSGALGIDKRDGLAEALEVLGRGDELVVAKLDRLARDTYLNAYITLQVEKKGAKILSATEEALNGDDEMAKFMKTIISAFATFERAQIRIRTKQTLQMKKEAGFRISRYAPYGYDFTDDKKRVVANEEEQKVLSLIKEMKDTGEGAAAVKNELNNRGIKTKQGKSTWHYQSVYKIYQKVA